jgi:hypothetical protein
MDLRTFISDLQKMRSINSQFQTKLGEITLSLNNNPQQFLNSPRELIILFIKTLQAFLCHTFYIDYVSKKSSNRGTSNLIDPERMVDNRDQTNNNLSQTNNITQGSSVYDNSMNLILVISAKISKMHLNYAKVLIGCFLEHINTHSDCFNYIISFYRLYISCSQIKAAGKELGLYSYLFELYKKIYKISHKFEQGDINRVKDVEGLMRLKENEMFDQGENKNFLARNFFQGESKYFLENFANNLKNKHDESEKIEKLEKLEKSGERNINYLESTGSILHNTNTQNQMMRGSNENNAKNNFFNSNNAGKFLKSERKGTNRTSIKNLSNDFGVSILSGEKIDTQFNQYNQFSQQSHQHDSNINNHNVTGSFSKEKIKIPELKFPLANQHHYSFTRSSRRNDFSKSGAGLSTNHTGKIKDRERERILIDNRAPRSGAEKDTTFIRKEILIDNSSSNNNRQFDFMLEDNLISPQQKLKALGLQLGESCLATDLAALINQKRDLELEKIAKGRGPKSKDTHRSSHKRKFSNQRESDYIDKLKYNYIESDSEHERERDDRNLQQDNMPSQTQSNFSTFSPGKDRDRDRDSSSNAQLRNLLHKKPLIKRDQKEDHLNPNTQGITHLNMNSVSHNLLDFTKDFKKNFVFSFDNYNIGLNSHIDKTYRNFIKIREIISNFILSCLREFSIDEFHLLKVNFNLIYSFLLLPSFDQIRKKLERKKCESLEHMREFSQDQLAIASEGSFLITENKENLIKNILLVEKSNITLHSDDLNLMKNLKPNLREKGSFESFLSINLDDEKDRYSSLSLKSEYDAICEILSFSASSCEHILKGQNFYKSIFHSVENSESNNVEFWCSGILFNHFKNYNLEDVRNHSDPFLERIKNRVTFILKNFSIVWSKENYNYNHNPNFSNFSQNSIQICKALKQQLEILKEYINSSSSKSKIIPIHLIFQFSEILIIFKKIFIENFLNYGPFEISGYEIKLAEKLDYSNTDIKIPDELLELFISYLEILSKIIVDTQIFTCEKLLNDLFIICPSFLEIVKFVIIYIFTKDLSGSNIGGVSMPFTSSGVSNNPFYRDSTNKFQFSSNRTNSIITSNPISNNPKYNLSNFIKEAENFNNNNLSQNINNLQSTENFVKMFEKYKEYLQHSLSLISYLYNNTVFYHKIIRRENLDKAKNEEKESSKFWVGSIREYLKFINFFINSKFGIFYDYILNYGSYIKMNSIFKDKVQETNKENSQIQGNSQNSPNFNYRDNRDRESHNLNNILNPNNEKQNLIINFSLTRSLLNLQRSVFEFNHKFSFIVNETSSLHFIRMHYISFIKLYNKNLDFKAKLGDVGKILENSDKTSKKKKVKALIRGVYNDQNNLQVIINLCKLHLQCLLSLAKNRNFDVTNKFFQLRLVDFMVKELDLEHEATQKLYRVKNFIKKERESVKNVKVPRNDLDEIKFSEQSASENFKNKNNRPSPMKPFSLNLNSSTGSGLGSNPLNRNFTLSGNNLTDKYKFQQEVVPEERSELENVSLHSKLNQETENNNKEDKNYIIENLEMEGEKNLDQNSNSKRINKSRILSGTKSQFQKSGEKSDAREYQENQEVQDQSILGDDDPLSEDYDDINLDLHLPNEKHITIKDIDKLNKLKISEKITEKISENLSDEKNENEDEDFDDEDFDDDDYDSDLSDIMLVDLKPKINPYEDKIPKLSLIPTTISDGSLGGAFPQKPVLKLNPSLSLNKPQLKDLKDLNLEKKPEVGVISTSSNNVKNSLLSEKDKENVYATPHKILAMKQNLSSNPKFNLNITPNYNNLSQSQSLKPESVNIEFREELNNTGGNFISNFTGTGNITSNQSNNNTLNNILPDAQKKKLSILDLQCIPSSSKIQSSIDNSGSKASIINKCKKMNLFF